MSDNKHEAPLSATVGAEYGIPEVSVTALIAGYREETRFLSDGLAHTGNILCDVIERQAAEITALTRRQQAADGLVEALKDADYVLSQIYDAFDFELGQPLSRAISKTGDLAKPALAAYEASAGGSDKGEVK